MNYLASICLLLCAITIYAIDMTKFVEKSCTPIVDEIMQKEECKNYKLPAYLEKYKQKLSKNKQAKLMMSYFDKVCCAMVSAGIVSEETPLDIDKLKELASEMITDNNIKAAMLTCIDDETDGVSAEILNIADFFPQLSGCILCNCMTNNAKKFIGSIMSC